MTLSRTKKRRKRPAESCRILQMALGIFGTFVLSIVSGCFWHNWISWIDSSVKHRRFTMCPWLCVAIFSHCSGLATWNQFWPLSQFGSRPLHLRSFIGCRGHGFYTLGEQKDPRSRKECLGSHGVFEGILASTGCFSCDFRTYLKHQIYQSTRTIKPKTNYIWGM